MSNTTNQFLDLMKTFMNPEFYTNSMKGLSAVDAAGFAQALEKGARIVDTTNKIAMDYLHQMFAKNSEAVQNNTVNMMQSIKHAISSGDFKQISELQQQYLKSAMEESSRYAKDFSNMASEAYTKMMQSIAGLSEQMQKASDNIKTK